MGERGMTTPRAQLHLITDRKRCRGDLLAAVRAALGSGVDWVQVREKSAPALDVFRLVCALAPVCRDRGVGLLVNDRVDVALAAGAQGVHLARKSLPPQVARRLLTARHLLGCSVHSLPEALEAVRGGADYVTFGNVFPTASHPGLPPRGVESLREVVVAVEVPVIAVGGITLETLPQVLATGCAGVAVIGAILESPDPGGAARAFREALEASPVRPRHPFPLPPTVDAGVRP
jgi:thiamine-phosphate pyrophosphorylase